MSEEARQIPKMLDGEVRRTAPGSKYHVDHRHVAAVEFDLVVGGAGTLMMDEHVYELKPGALVWMPPAHQHRLNRSPQLEMWVVVARSELMPSEWLADMARQPLRLLAGEELVDLDRLLSQVAQDSDHPVTYNAGIRYALMRAWRASSDEPPADIRPMHPAVSQALLLLRESGASLSLSELAKATGIMASYLSRLLTDNTGHGFMEWRNRIRIDRFLTEYRPGANLLNVALDAGFGSYSSFHHVFSDLMGCAPSEWVRHVGETHAGDSDHPAPPPDEYALPQSTIVSTRLRWTRLASVVSPAVGTLLGPRFLERVLAGRAEALPSVIAAEAEFDGSLPETERRGFIAGLAASDPRLASEFSEILEKHDFGENFAGLLREFGLSQRSLPGAMAAMAAALWTATHGASDPAVEPVRALSRQMAAALHALRPKPTASVAQAAHTALICHFIVLYHALQAARAQGDSRAMTRLAQIASASARKIFGLDMKKIDFTARGFTKAT